MANHNVQQYPERLLMEALARMKQFRQGRVAVHVHLSGLQQHHKKDNYLRIAQEQFETQVQSYAGHIFILENGDLFFIGKDVQMETLTRAVDKLRLLFAEDPLASYPEDEEGKAFATFYDFASQYDLLCQDVQLIIKAADRQRKDDEEKKNKKPVHGRIFQAQDLARLVALLERADATNLVRRQTACLFLESGVPQPLFEETFIAISDLQRICAPEIDLLSDKWLFRYLSRTLDKRVMAFMVKDGLDGSLPFSLNLNVETILSPEFRSFDQAVPQALRGQMVIELNKVDVFSDIGAYLFARDLLRARGYKLCLDGLTHHTLPFFDRTTLDLDYVKIFWTPEGLKTAHPSALPAIRAVLADFGPQRAILCRCESEDAIKAGHALGITRFQGHMIDRLLNYSRMGKK